MSQQSYIRDKDLLIIYFILKTLVNKRIIHQIKRLLIMKVYLNLKKIRSIMNQIKKIRVNIHKNNNILRVINNINLS